MNAEEKKHKKSVKSKNHKLLKKLMQSLMDSDESEEETSKDVYQASKTPRLELNEQQNLIFNVNSDEESIFKEQSNVDVGDEVNKSYENKVIREDTLSRKGNNF